MDFYTTKRKKALLICALLWLNISPLRWQPASAAVGRGTVQPETGPDPASDPGSSQVYLPLAIKAGVNRSGITPRVNAPFFAEKIAGREMAVFWFGRVNADENYADVRVGYTGQELVLRLAVFDKRLWYDKSPTVEEMESWDSASLILNLDGSQGEAPGSNAHRFTAQLNWWEAEADFQAAQRGDGSGWTAAATGFTTSSGWRGNAPNNDETGLDRGWTLSYHIPFASLGLTGQPPDGTIWGLAVALHDRDREEEGPLPDQTWPAGAELSKPATWGQIHFGLPTYAPAPIPAGGTTTIRQGLNGASVVDGEVGGGSVCGAELDYWTQWGDTPTPGGAENADLNIQNQTDVADWPCFSKAYLTFPLGALPTGKTILSATLKLHQFGNAGGGEWGQPPRSLIQVFTVADDWQEASLTWNNAPLAVENVSRAWVDPLASFPGWPGAARTWDLTYAVAQAYAAQTPLRLALYSADEGYHSGKYFVSSDALDWNAAARPALEIVWGDP